MRTGASKWRNYDFRKRVIVRWAEGERETLIAEALVQGKVMKIDLGVSGYDNLSEGGEVKDRGDALPKG